LNIGGIANRCAVLSTGFAVQHSEIIGVNPITSDGIKLNGFTELPIVILSAKDEPSLKDIEEKARKLDCSTFIFLTRAEGVRSYSAYVESIANSNSYELDIDAILIYGDKKKVNKTTGSLPMLR